MKTVYTTLPFYDKLAKQCFERAKKSRQVTDPPVPIMCPRHRLPSFLINAEADNPGQLQDIELIDIKGDSYQYNGAVDIDLENGSVDHFNTYTIAGDSVAAINLAGNATGFISEAITINYEYVYEIVLDMTLNSGAYPHISTYDVTGAWYPRTSIHQTQAGRNKIWLHPVGMNVFDNVRIMFYSTAVCNFNATIISIKRTLIHSWFAENGIGGRYTDMQQRDGFTIDAWTGTYDVRTETPSERLLILQKTTAAGYVGYVWHDAPMLASGVAVGDEFYIFCHVDYTSGTYPYMSVSDYTDATHELLSNEVQLTAGNNFIVLRVTTAEGTPTWGAKIMMYNKDTEQSNFAVTFYYIGRTNIPSLYTALSDDYFQYKGETLKQLIPEGIYYLKLTTGGGYVYYSDWFEVDCVYENLISTWLNNTYETFTSSGTEITSAIETGAAGTCQSVQTFDVLAGEVINVIFFHTQTSGAAPTLRLFSTLGSGTSSNVHTVIRGLNEVTFTATATTTVILYYINAAAANWSTSEIQVQRAYSEKYVTIKFSNTCDLGEILYSDGLEQTLWLESEAMEMSFPIDEEGAKDGNARFWRSFARQDKKYILRTNELPDFMADVLYRMMLHDTVELIDRVGDEHTVRALEVEHEWLGDDKYYAKFDLTFDYDEAVIIGGCCNNLT